MKRPLVCFVAVVFSFAAAIAAPIASADAQRKLHTHFVGAGGADELPLGAGQSEPGKLEPVPLDVIESEASYVFESDLNHGGSFGKQDAFDFTFEYSHRFHLFGNWYLRLGLAYSRFDFGQTAAPVPDHLQSGAALVGIDYMHGRDIGMLIQLRPGFYTENDIDTASFDIPITAGRIFVLQEDHLYLFTGVNVAFLRGGRPVVPLIGLIWTPNEQWHAMAMLPEPRVVYSPNKDWDFWVGGEFVGGSFRTDRDPDIHPAKLNGTQVDYEEYRAGGGLIYSPCQWMSVDFGAGCAIERGFKFHRAGENYRTDPAPYVRLQVKAKF